MIYKNRKYYVGNNKSRGYPFKFKVHYDKDIGELVLCRNTFFSWQHFSMEELEDMMAILKKVQKEKREDRL